MDVRRRLGVVIASVLVGTMAIWSVPAASADAAALPLAGIVIALDPGHNGGNAAHAKEIARLIWDGTGWRPCATVGTTTRSGYTEHRFNFLVALNVKAKLEKLGATVVMTRTSDTGVGPCVDVRGRFGTKMHARLTVAIHADGAPSADHGFYVMKPGLVKGYTDDIYSSSGKLATAVRAGLLKSHLSVANYYATNGIKNRTDFATFNFSDIPTVMVELGNMKNSADAGLMTRLTGQNRYADGLVAGIRIYLGR